MKKLIAKIKRYIYMTKVKWSLRKTPKFMRKAALWLSMFSYDTAEYLKRVQIGHPENLDHVAALHGITRVEGMTDNELREKIKGAVLNVRRNEG